MRTDYILALSDPGDFLHLISVGHCKGTELLMPETLRITDYHCIHYVLGGTGYYQDAVSGRRRIGKGDIVISYLKKGKNIRMASDDCVSRFTLFVQQQISKPELDYKSFLRREKISHEAFRKKFKHSTGFSPTQYRDTSRKALFG